MLFLAFAVLIVIGVPLLLADLFYALVLVTTLPGALWLAVRGTETTGKVTWVDKQRPGRGSQVIATYTAPAGTFQVSGTSGRPQIGAPAAVRYNPGNPAFATTVTDPWLRAATRIPMVLAAGAAGAGMATAAIWYFTGTHTALQVPVGGGAFALAITLMFAHYTAGRYAVLLRSRRMVQTDGTITRRDQNSPLGPGCLIAFETGDGPAEFWVRADSVRAGNGDTVTVHYDPRDPEATATLDTADDVRDAVIGGTVFTLILASAVVYAITLL